MIHPGQIQYYCKAISMSESCNFSGGEPPEGSAAPLPTMYQPPALICIGIPPPPAFAKNMSLYIVLYSSCSWWALCTCTCTRSPSSQCIQCTRYLRLRRVRLDFAFDEQCSHDHVTYRDIDESSGHGWIYDRVRSVFKLATRRVLLY